MGRRVWMMGSVVLLCVLAARAVSAGPASPELEAMAATERAFAKMAAEKGIREAFVEFFADDSVGFYPTPMNGREFYRAQPPTPTTSRLEWEPRTGDVASSGDLGWLTGPFASRNIATSTPPRHGCYFSIWRKQSDGSWKVLMDVGVATPEAPSFSAGFVPVAEPAGRFTRTASSQPASRDDLMKADRELSAAIGRDGTSRGYAAVLTPASRLHVPRLQPMVGTDAIAAWLASTARTMAFTPDTGDVAKSGDVGFTRGSYEQEADAGGAGGEQGYYVRMWKRASDGRWTLAVEVRNPLPQRAA